MKVIIIGGVAGGASCAARFRRLDEKAAFFMFVRYLMRERLISGLKMRAYWCYLNRIIGSKTVWELIFV